MHVAASRGNVSLIWGYGEHSQWFVEGCFLYVQYRGIFLYWGLVVNQGNLPLCLNLQWCVQALTDQIGLNMTDNAGLTFCRSSAIHPCANPYHTWMRKVSISRWRSCPACWIFTLRVPALGSITQAIWKRKICMLRSKRKKIFFPCP